MIEEITICCNCGNDPEIVKKQMDLLKPVESIFKVHWNNRIDRYPHAYPSFSKLVNDSIITSPTETVIWLNDRVTPTVQDIVHMVELLNEGYAVASKYSAAFMASTKEVYRQIGWWDERFYGGGYEDDDFVLRLRLANLAYYESQESEYLEARILNMEEKINSLIPEGAEACNLSGPHFNAKWSQSDDSITKVMKEEYYDDYEEQVGPSDARIRHKWKTWNESQLGVACRYPLAGESRTKWFCFLDPRNGSPIKENGVWKEYRPVFRSCDG
jgi:hypothetical protein